MEGGMSFRFGSPQTLERYNTVISDGYVITNQKCVIRVQDVTRNECYGEIVVTPYTPIIRDNTKSDIIVPGQTVTWGFKGGTPPFTWNIIGNNLILNPNTSPLQALQMENIQKQKIELFKIAANMGENGNSMITAFATVQGLNSNDVFTEFRNFCSKAAGEIPVSKMNNFISKDVPYLSDKDTISITRLATYLADHGVQNHLAYIPSHVKTPNIYQP